MRLSTIVCAEPSCDNEVTGDIAMYHVVARAAEEGWTFHDDSELGSAFCPLHGPDGPLPTEKWLVGCWTCTDEWDAVDEEDAKAQAQEHDCEADTYIKSPKKISEEAIARAERYAERKARLVEEEAHALLAAELATARQRELERRARNWLRLRNTIVFWKKVKQ